MYGEWSLVHFLGGSWGPSQKIEKDRIMSSTLVPPSKTEINRGLKQKNPTLSRHDAGPKYVVSAFGGTRTHEYEYTWTWVKPLRPLGHECWVCHTTQEHIQTATRPHYLATSPARLDPTDPTVLHLVVLTFVVPVGYHFPINCITMSKLILTMYNYMVQLNSTKAPALATNQYDLLPLASEQEGCH